MGRSFNDYWHGVHRNAYSLDFLDIFSLLTGALVGYGRTKETGKPSAHYRLRAGEPVLRARLEDFIFALYRTREPAVCITEIITKNPLTGSLRLWFACSVIRLHCFLAIVR